MESTVRLRQVRDLSELIQASFAFTRQEFKALFGLVAAYAGPFILMYAISMAYYQGEMQRFSADPNQFLDPNATSLPEMLGSMFKPIMTMVLFGGVSMVMLTLITTHYLKMYLRHGSGNFSKEDVWASAREHLGSFFGLTLGYLGITSLGMVLLFVPGIYWYVAFSLLYMVRVMEDTDFTTSFGRSQELIRGHWWFTLGYYIVFSILISIVSGVLGLAQGVVQAVQLTTGYDQVLNWVYMGMGGVVAFLSYFLYVPFYIGQGLHYFNLVERKESPSLRDKIDRIN